jgi:phospholipid-binding lipoprotein MlaA
MRALALAAALLLPAAGVQAAGDPLEAVNRHVHGFNLRAQRHVLAPAASAWRGWAPAPVREGIGNALANLGEPVTAASALLAGEPRMVATAALRFGINTTLGYGGMRDPASGMGYPRASLGVADALCRWGVPPGPYLVLPLLGPSTLRDAAGGLATSLALSHMLGAEAVAAWGAASGFVDYADWQPQLDRLERNAIDGYAALRSIHAQRRAASCPLDGPPEEDEEEDEEEDADG